MGVRGRLGAEHLAPHSPHDVTVAPTEPPPPVTNLQPQAGGIAAPTLQPSPTTVPLTRLHTAHMDTWHRAYPCGGGSVLGPLRIGGPAASLNHRVCECGNVMGLGGE